MTKAEADRAIADARAAGINIEMIEHNLRLTPEQRWRQHDEAREAVEAFERVRDKKFFELTIIQMVRPGNPPLVEVCENGEKFLIGGGSS
jgi:hypothetical protein